jgi:hypothetical protein
VVANGSQGENQEEDSENEEVSNLNVLLVTILDCLALLSCYDSSLDPSYEKVIQHSVKTCLQGDVNLMAIRNQRYPCMIEIMKCITIAMFWSLGQKS